MAGLGDIYRNCGIGAGRRVPHAQRVSGRVLIVDDHPAFRAAARELLTHRGYSVVGESACAETAIAAAARLQPDAVLLDVHLGDDDGLEVARAIQRTCPRAAVLLVSNCDYGDNEFLVRRAGAVGFLVKSRLAAEDLGEYWG
jgi:DNA-binding NarL/FixJ family response regulator